MAGPAGPHSATPAELQDRIAAERSGWPFLLWRAGGEQRILLLDDDLDHATVGRGDEIDVGLDDDGQVSRLHADPLELGVQA